MRSLVDMTFSSFWDEKLKKYAAADWANKPSLFAEWAVAFFPPGGRVLELGAGHGQDSQFFARKGFSVVSSDFSDVGLEYNRGKMPKELESRVLIQRVDIAEPLLFDDEAFDVVYSHLGLHYFDSKKTVEIFDEIYRVLKSGGVLAVLVNSTNDPEYGSGTKLEDRFYEVEGIHKRYFSLDSLRRFVGKFKEVIADNQGETYKDRAKGTEHLLRFVGKKV